jgi:hypothetical protein
MKMRDLSAEELKWADREILADRLAELQKDRAERAQEISGLSFLIWSNEHHMWWRDDERGYTDSIEEAGRCTYKRAVQIVREASVDGRRLFDRTNYVTGEQYRQAPEVLVLAPEHVDLEGGTTRG